MKTRNTTIRLALAVLACGAGQCLSAQGAATIVGVVRDQNGKTLSAAAIEAIGQKTAEKRSAVAGDDGVFTLMQLPPDKWQVTARLTGGEDVSSIVELGAGQTRNLAMMINTASTTTLIAIDNTATTIESASARLGANISAGQTATLPVNGRTFGALALEAPLVSNSGGGALDTLHFAGQATSQNRYVLDGVDASSVVAAYPGFLAAPGHQFRLSMSVEGVQEFRVDAASYPADAGGASGARVSMLSKSGGGQWHGSLFEYFRNDALQARNFFDDSTKAPLHMNQFGGSAGGYLIRDRLFAFASVEELQQSVGASFFQQVPSDHEREEGVADIAAWLAAIPSPFRASADEEEGIAMRRAVARQNERAFNGRLDWLPSALHRVMARYSRSSGSMLAPDNSVTERNLSGATRFDHSVVSWVAGAGAGWSNEFTAGMNRSPTRVSSAGVPDAIAGSRVTIGAASQDHASPGGLLRLFNGAYGRGAEYRGRSYTASEAMNWVNGTHMLKFGLEFRAIRAPFRVLGGTQYTFREFESFLENEDVDVTYTEDMDFRRAKQEQWAAYALDQWRLRPNLVLNLGLRYEYSTATREHDNRAVLLDPFRLTSVDAHGGFYRPGQLGFAPRLSIAWSPKLLGGKTVLRAGAGLYQGSPAFLETVLPIEDQVEHLFMVDAVVPVTQDNLREDPGVLRIASVLDAGSFGRLQRTYSYMASVQQALPAKIVAELAYAGSISRNLTQRGVANAAIGLDAATGELVRPHSGYTAVRYLANNGKASYNALRVGLNRKFVGDLTLAASYNWSHAIADTEGAGESYAPQDPGCFRCERASSSFDLRHTLNVDFVYALPFGKNRRHFSTGWAARVLGGWSLAGVWNIRSGLPVNVVINRPDEIYYSPSSQLFYAPFTEIPDDAHVVLNIPGGGEDRSSMRPNYIGGTADSFAPANFSVPLPGTFGNLGRNALRGPGFSQVDAQITRTWQVTERTRLQFRLEAFNLANHTNLANPSAVLPDELLEMQPGSAFSAATAGSFGASSSTVGRTIGLGTSRQLQLSARFEW